MTTGSITSLGIGSSLDLQGMLDTQREADEAIAGLKLDEIESQTAVKNQLNSLLNQLLSMKTSSLNLSLSSTYLYRSVAVSDTEVASATVLDGTELGSHRVVTDRLASSSSYISGGTSSATACVYVPTVQESTGGYEETQIVLAEEETLEIQYGPEDAPQTITITGVQGGMTAEQLVSAVNSDAANLDAGGNTLVTASTFEDEDGNIRIRIEAASRQAGKANRVSVSGASAGFAPPVSQLSFKTGEDGPLYSISVPAETTLEGLVGRINEDENNPGVSAKIVDTGIGDTPYQLVLESNETGEDARITIVGEPPGLTLNEKNGSGYAMMGDAPISFDSPIVVDGTNNTIAFEEDTGKGYGQGLFARIEEGVYETAQDLAQAVESALETESASNGNGSDYQVRIDEDTGKITIGEAGTLEGVNIKWGEGETTASTLLGFSQSREITPTASSLNAMVTVDDITYQRQGNQNLTGIIEGVTLSLYATGVTTITVDASTTSIETEIAGLVETYNTLMTEIDENDDYDEDTDTWGTLSQSNTAKSLEQELLGLFSTTVTTGGSITSLIDLGIEVNRDGTITLDAEELSRQLSENFDDVRSLLLGSDTEEGLADILNEQIGVYALSDGYIDNEIDAIGQSISRLEDNYQRQMENLDKKYETMALEYAALDAYLAELASTQSYLEQMLSTDED